MTTETITVKSLEELLEGSAAGAEFKQAVRNLAAGRPQGLIRAGAGCPPIKVLRVVCKLLDDYAELLIARVEIEGESGCSEFVGRAAIEPGGHRFEFEWNCAWRAEERGWRDAFGDLDQARAARMFDYQCFRRMERI
jgi:hypothetical protein